MEPPEAKRAEELKNIEHVIAGSPAILVDKYDQYNKWCKDNGVHMPKLEYPAVFEGGLIGARVTEEIAHREAFIFVPYKMLSTVGKA